MSWAVDLVREILLEKLCVILPREPDFLPAGARQLGAALPLPHKTLAI
jgi:hypothetical protein